MKKNFHIVILSLIFSIILWGSISLSYDYYATYEIPIKLINFPAGYTTGSALPKDVSIKLKGKGWKLIAVSIGAKSDYLVSADGDSGKRYINLYNYLTENQWLSNEMEVIDISPDTLSFFVEKIAHKKVKIFPNLVIDFKSGYGLGSLVKIMPDSTIVYGPVSKLKNLNSVTTRTIKLTELDNIVERRFPLEDLQGMKYRDPSVIISLDVQKIVDKNFENIPVEIRDVPRDRSVVLLPNKIDIGIRGGIDILGRMKDTDFKSFLFYRDVVLDTIGSVVPQVEVPENTSLIYIKPERLRYIIKKFN